MPDTHVVAERPAQDEVARYDAIVIGAGISGMFMLYRLRELGMTARVFEAGTNLGGTWYWNRYPGARFDSESWTYGYSFSKELMREWDWKEHFSPLDRQHRRHGDAITSRRHQHLSEAIRRGPKIPPPAVDQTWRHVGLTRHVSHYRTGLECRRHNRPLLLGAPP